MRVIGLDIAPAPKYKIQLPGSNGRGVRAAMEQQKNTVYPRGTDSAKVIQVIETRAARGSGSPKDLSRIVTQYWDFEGNLLAENDPSSTNGKWEDV